MSIRLTDSKGQSLKVNAWNWGVLHYAVECAKLPLFDDEGVLGPLLYGGTNLELDEGQVRKLHDFLSEVLLPKIPSGHRMTTDFSITSEPDDGTFNRDDLAKNYSLRHNVLVNIINFLATAHAPIRVC
jgi:hypothetical protein